MFESFLKRGKLIIILFFVIILVGGYLFYQLPKCELPEFSANILSISTVYPGADAEAVESDVTEVLEDALKNLEGIESINSVSAQEFSNVIIEVDDSGDFEKISGEIKQKVSDNVSKLPEDAFDPEVKKAATGLPVGSYMFTADSSESLKESQEEILKLREKVQGLDGVSGVTIKGFKEKEALLKLDSDELAENGLNVSAIIEAINNEYKTTPLGETKQDGENVRLSLNQYKDIEQIKELAVQSPITKELIQVGDLAELAFEEKDQADIVSYNGKPAYSFTVTIDSGLDIPAAFTKVDEEIKNELNLPEGVELETYYSQKADVDTIFDDLIKEAVIAVLAVILITTLGLTLSGAFIVSLAIPLSITLGTIPLPFLDVDLNQISVIGLIIALGILVDDAIVVNDNILRQYKLQKNGNALQATRDGVKEVWGSIVTSTLAVVFAFLPLTLLSGSNGSFIRSLPSVLILTVVASMIISLTLVPVYQYAVNKKSIRSSEKEPGFLGKPLKKLSDFYADTLLAKIVKRPVIIGVGGIVATSLIFLLAFYVPFEFFPSANKKEVTVTVTMPTDYTLEETNSVLEELEKDLLEIKETEETAIFAGTGVPGLFSETVENAGPNTGQIVARIDNEAVTADQYIEENTDGLREKYPDAEIFLTTIVQGPPTGAPVTVKVSGEDFNKLNDIKNELAGEIQEADNGLIIDNVKAPLSSIQYNLDRDALTENGLDPTFISDQIRLVTEGLPMGTFKSDNENIDLVIKQDTEIHQEGIQLDEIEVPLQTEGPVPQTAPLSDFVDTDTIEQYQTIPREDGERTITLKAYPGESETFKEDVAAIVDEFKDRYTDEGYSLTLGGENDDQTQFFIEISLLFLVVLVLIYITIAFQFNSLSLPLLVLGTVYLAVAGAVAGLFVTQTPFSFMATMGIVSLAGIVVRNSVVLFEFIEQRIKAGYDRTEAVMEAGRARIRPILLTAFTALVALLPVAFSNDPLFKPLAISIVSGVLFSTILTLLIVPALYIVVDKLRAKRRKV
ncbi:efflux RND transporter permease subunit [Peribacillus frigoritolerans]|uniref:efflux RND transporter permease subunit n=1 Tax=Peribacillus frigoritolerans TaxID=450367 RepID=UPI0010599C0E|nr:efflux RND transporter permease subunit [Peribacillus frigoritolerans]TDL82943.1 efflux RND transporter permease subunit [Peribacillus frigoritolerans]